MPVILIIALVVGLLWWLSRGADLFCLSVRDGRILPVRGRVPPTLLSDFRDIVARPPVHRATLRAVREVNGARLIVSGDIDEGRAQRLRNVFGLFPIARLRAAPPVSDRTLGQVLGIAWLAWLLDRSRF